MRATILFLIVFLCTQQSTFCQAKKTITATAQYEVVYLKNGQKIINDVCQLDITKSGSYFCSTGKQENLSRIQKKYEKSQSSGTPMKFERGDLLTNLCNFEIEKDYTRNKAFYIQDVGDQSLGFQVDTLSSKRWKLLPETAMIGKLMCHKASMTKDTIQITAWYCIEIPLRDGPNYFYGLPGLIIKATTNTGFDIKLTSFNYAKDQNRILNIKSYAVVKESQLKKAMLNQRALNKNGTLPNGDALKQVTGN
ncbi:GLPGLI family protein [Mucilaginibacter sp.]|uniref:GLPGLI family protein n=1 Tax=Mucilaginibacter sp. TaxID=1882438 RepID=UPI0025EB3445|nr:GLPGLI family protein [Mucilaginibacter sp.]